jgi:dehydrogenase/reductase SDR family protein 7B
MSMEYRGKVIWITGASSGIGEALAYALHKKGAKLILSARRVDELERVKSECLRGDTGTDDTGTTKTTDTKPAQNSIVILPLDLSQPETFAEKTTQAINAFGHVDMLINNGGMGQRAKAIEAHMDTIRRVMEVNFFGTVGLTQAIAPHMMQRGQGSIVVISSVMGKIGTAWRSTYAASKHALHGFFDSMRHEVSEQGIEITLVCPGFVSTDITKHALLADGSTFGKIGRGQMDGMPADQFAETMLAKLGRGKKEIFIGGKEVYAVYLKRISLNLLDFVLKRADIK